MVAEIQVMTVLSDDVSDLATVAEGEGYDFVSRLIQDWADGSNLFDRPGEVLLAARVDEVLVAVGGLNTDPYMEAPEVARVRHLYVHPGHRGTGIGKELVRRLLDHARGHYRRVRLRAGPPEAGAFYSGLGFSTTDEPDATHTLDL